MGGVVAAGKSTVADAIAIELSAPVVDADRTRKHMLGVDPAVHIEEGAWHGAYDPRFTERVYAEVLRRGAVVLASGRTVVLDASFRSREMRRRARELASSHGVPLRFVECRAAPEVCKARLARREREAGVSDARASLYDDFVARYEAPDELAPGERLVLDTAQPLEASLATLRAHLETWPRGLVG